MKVLLQRVSEARVLVGDDTVGAIDRGLLLLAGFEKHDDTALLQRMTDKILAYRVFADDAGKMNRNVREVGGGVLVVSQFTLAADTRKGLRPGFSVAAPPLQAENLYNTFINQLRSLHTPVATGIFAAEMQVHLVNDGPVTFLLQL